MSEELAKYESPTMMELARDPEEVLKEARKAAEALTKIVQQKPDKVIINDEQYLELVDWQLLGRFYGLRAKIKETKPVEFGSVRGWEARAVLVDRAGREVSAAEAMCLNDEEKWSTKPKYEFHYVLKDGKRQKEDPPRNMIVWENNPKSPGKKRPKKERVKVGDEPVPFFQLRSMAQTRALAKVYRNDLSWVVVLAGYKPVTAEEMSGPEDQMTGGPDDRQTGGLVDRPTGKEEDPIITEDQRQSILTQLKKKNLALDHLEGYLAKNLSAFRLSDVNAALDWITKQKAG
jgi:hypothetical protein